MIRPLGDRVVVELEAKEEKTASGIILPDTARIRPNQGKVVAVGTGILLTSGERAALEVNVGDFVIFSERGGSDITLEGKDYVILSEIDILAVVG